MQPWILSDNLAYGFATASAGNGFDLFVTKNRGATWTNQGTFTQAAGTITTTYQVMELPSGAFIIGVATGDPNTGDRPISVWATNGTLSRSVMTGLTDGGGATTTKGLAQLGSTLIAQIQQGGGSTSFVCRSTNAGASWACYQPGTTVQAASSETVAVAGSAFFLAADDGVWRSLNDGASFVRVFNQAATKAHIKCLTSLVCVFTAGQDTVYRTADGGATWGAAFVASVNPQISGFVNYGGGIVAALPGVASRNVWLSPDYGVSWAPVFTFAAAQSCGAPCTAVALNGSAIATFATTSLTSRNMYSSALQKGTLQIVGSSGFAAQVDANGRLLTNPTWTVAGPVTVALTQPAIPLHVKPIQSFTLQNSSTTGAANTAVVVTFGAAANIRHHIYKVSAFCAAAGTANIIITDGGTTKYQTVAAGVTTVAFTETWPVGLTFATNSAAVVTLSACGAGNTGTLTVQSDQSPGL
jgi:hypothetical protein